MNRRDALISAAGLAGMSVMTPTNALAAEQGPPARFGEIIIPPAQEIDKEKHVPIITAPMSVQAGQPFDVTIEVGKVVAHPNTVEHHIMWIQLFALEEGSQYAKNLGKFDFFPAYSNPKVTIPVMLQTNATLYALEHCNLHGLWDYSVKVNVTAM